MEIVVHSKKYLLLQNFQKKLHHLNRNSQLRNVIVKVIYCNWASGVGQKNPTTTPSVVVVRNPTPTPPKNLRLRLRNPANNKL